MVKKTSISLDEETFQLCEKYAAENSRSRSEFIAAAIQKYISDLELGKHKNIIAKELADEIVKGSEAGVTKISKGLFRYAVEVEMIIMILSELADIPPEVMEEYRKEAIRNVRRTRGKINLDDLIARNNRELAEQKISVNGTDEDTYVNEYTIDDYDFMEEDI
ncbi:MAG: ribbon-helix-helix protein, CopG family [Ruminococcaceae bacterium]|nr:ribbon-helix-helix protein, CopG family [Oscillospiraceae bacterium]